MSEARSHGVDREVSSDRSALARVRVGLFADALEPSDGDPDRLRATLGQVADASIDHLCVGDHVSFFVGAGSDGLISAASLLAVQARLPVYVGLYLLPLRHPVTVARQLATIAQLAPGRLTLGIGLGGEDRHEIEICGVDPTTAWTPNGRMPSHTATSGGRHAGDVRRRVLCLRRCPDPAGAIASDTSHRGRTIGGRRQSRREPR